MLCSLCARTYECVLMNSDDLTGYEYVEDAEERQLRLGQLARYEAKLLTEIDRRDNNPTDIEQVGLFCLLQHVMTPRVVGDV